MLSEPARILAVSGDQVQLETSRKSACGKCGMKSGCGQYLFGPEREALWLSRDALDTDAAGELVPGANVTLGVPGSRVAGLALLFYLLPLLALMLTMLLASQLGANEGWLALSALAGLVAGLAVLPSVLRMQATRLRCTLTMSPVQVPAEFQESRI